MSHPPRGNSRTRRLWLRVYTAGSGSFQVPPRPLQNSQAGSQELDRKQILLETNSMLRTASRLLVTELSARLFPKMVSASDKWSVLQVNKCGAGRPGRALICGKQFWGVVSLTIRKLNDLFQLWLFNFKKTKTKSFYPNVTGPVKYIPKSKIFIIFKKIKWCLLDYGVCVFSPIPPIKCK